jgi:O-antigen ligase
VSKARTKKNANAKSANVKGVKTIGGLQAGSTPDLRASAFPFGFDSLAGLAAFGLFALTLFLAPYFFSGFWPATYEYWPNALFLALASCISVLLALSSQAQAPPLRRSSASLLLLLLFAWCALSLLRTVYLHDSLLEIARVGGIIACFFFARAFLSARDFFAVRAWVLTAAVSTGISLAGMVGFQQYAARPDRIFATFYNPNLLANYCALALPLGAAGVLLAWRMTRRHANNSSRFVLIAGLIVLAIIALALILTGSKGGFLATLCGIVIFAVAVVRAKGERVRRVLRAQRVAVAIIAILVLIVGGFLFSKTIVPRLSSNIQSDHSTMFRVYTWAGTFEMVKARPLLGWGAGSFPSVITQFSKVGYTRSAHQSWLQLAAESGFPAMLFLLAACAFSFARGWKNLRDKNWPIIAGSLGALAAFVGHGLVDSGWGIVSIGVLLMLVLAILDAADESPIANRQSSINWPFLILALPLALGSLVYQRAQNGEELRRDSREAMLRGLPATALEKARDAIAADSLSARMWSNLADAQAATGRDAGNAHILVTRLQPTRALNFLDLAQYLIARGGDRNRIRQSLDRAVSLDANNPQIRLARGNWLLRNGDESGWEDLEWIASLAEKPYGKYPATPEMVDVDFARAYAKLAARDVKRKDFESAKKYVMRGLQEIETAREYEPSRRALETATYGAPDEKRAQELDELSATLWDLLDEMKTAPTGKN